MDNLGDARDQLDDLVRLRRATAAGVDPLRAQFHHSPQAVFDESALAIGARYARLAADRLAAPPRG